MKQTLRFGRQRCERFVTVKVYSYAVRTGTVRVGARIFS